ncbi:MAG: type I pullulanase [Acutalibacteraceae bacterium]
MFIKKLVAMAMVVAITGTCTVSQAFAANTTQVTSGSYYNSVDSYSTYYKKDLGATYTAESTTFKVWAPLATEVKVNLYTTGSDSEEGAKYLGNYSMTKDKGSNVWSTVVNGDLNKIYYTYSITNNGVTTETQDVYSVATGVNGKRSMVIDLDSTDPQGWEQDKHMLVDKQTDAVIWEVHVRDFSISDTSGVKDEYQGKYLAFTQDGTTINGTDSLSTCIDYLVEQGVNYVHLNPVYDYGSVDETKLNTPQYNWGYDPVNYNVPEGSYSTNPYDGEVRINEFKQMVQALHNRGIGVVMDVVYNHTYSASDSCFEKTVPGYYYRMSSATNFCNGSGCGNVTASDKDMFRKYMIDSVMYWAEEYHIDGFRFDLMGCHDITTMNEIRRNLDTIDKRILMYGEPWMADWGSNGIGADEACVMANASQVDSRIAMFSDKIRNTLKGGTDDASTGYIQGSTTVNHDLKAGMMGGSSVTFGQWANAPSQCVTYNSAHDNLCLWDKIVKSNGSTNFNSTNNTYLAQNKLSAAIVLTSQGIPFYMAGEEFARTKFGDHNSYQSPDNINAIDWSRVKTYNNLVQYYKGLMEIRANYSPFRASDTSAIDTTYFVENGSALGYTIRNTSNNASKEWGTVAVLVNNNRTSKTLSLKMNGGTLPNSWVVVANGDKAGLESLGTVNGSTVTVPARSALILVDKATFNQLVVKEKMLQNVTTTHIDKATGEVLKTTTTKIKQGGTYSTSADATILEDYILSETVGATSGVVGESDVNVTYYYEKDSTPRYYITTQYISQNGTELATATTEKYKLGDVYTATPKVIKGYQLDTSKLPVVTGKTTKDMTVTFTYTPVEESRKLKVHFYNSDNWDTVTMYAYDERTGTTKYLTDTWPGSAMTAEANGWYTYPEIDSDYAQVIFTNGDTLQNPGANQPGYEITGEKWIKDGVIRFNSKVVVSHIDKRGNKLKDDEVITDTLKSTADKYKTSADETLGNVVTVIGNPNGYCSDDIINVIYVYQTEDDVTVDYVLGDATGDNKVSLADALYILKVIVGQIDITDTVKLTSIDCNVDGSISLADALMVMKYTVNDSKSGNVGNTYTTTITQ